MLNQPLKLNCVATENDAIRYTAALRHLVFTPRCAAA